MVALEYLAPDLEGTSTRGSVVHCCCMTSTATAGVLMPDVAEARRAYLAARGSTRSNELGEPLIVADGNCAPGHRISRHVVDCCLSAANVDCPGVSNQEFAPHERDLAVSPHA